MSQSAVNNKRTIRGGKAANAKSNANANADDGASGQRNYISEAHAKQVLTKLHASGLLTDFPSLKQVQATLETFIDHLVQKACEGETVTITNFATFKRHYVPHQDHHNPRIKDQIIPKPEHYKMKVDIKPALKKTMSEIPVDKADRVIRP